MILFRQLRIMMYNISHCLLAVPSVQIIDAPPEDTRRELPTPSFLHQCEETLAESDCLFEVSLYFSACFNQSDKFSLVVNDHVVGMNLVPLVPEFRFWRTAWKDQIGHFDLKFFGLTGLCFVDIMGATFEIQKHETSLENCMQIGFF